MREGRGDVLRDPQRGLSIQALGIHGDGSRLQGPILIRLAIVLIERRRESGAPSLQPARARMVLAEPARPQQADAFPHVAA